MRLYAIYPWIFQLPGKLDVFSCHYAYELKRDHPDLKVIAITGYRGSYNRLPAAEFVGAQRSLVKPFTNDQILEAVNELLGEANSA